MNDSYDQYAEEWAKRVRGKKKIRHELLEKPAMVAELPDLSGKTVLCIGCGSGEECAYIKERGAQRVVGIDISKGLIEQARYAYPDVEFHTMDMERMDFDSNTFDYIYSSLALHYAEDLGAVLHKAHDVLKNGGVFLFSTHHPVRWGALSNKQGDRVSYLLGYEKDENDTVTVYGDYLNPRKITDTWFDQLQVTYYHKPLSEIFTGCIQAGFVLSKFIEPKPVPAIKQERPDLWEIHNKIPLFMILELRKK